MRRACHDTKYEYAAQSAKSAEECKQVLSYPSLFGFSDVVGLAGKDGRIVPVFVLTLPPALMIIPTRHGDGDSSFRSTVKAALKKPTSCSQASPSAVPMVQIQATTPPEESFPGTTPNPRTTVLSKHALTKPYLAGRGSHSVASAL